MRRLEAVKLNKTLHHCLRGMAPLLTACSFRVAHHLILIATWEIVRSKPNLHRGQNKNRITP